jgi:hypothetical protein
MEVKNNFYLNQNSTITQRDKTTGDSTQWKASQTMVESLIHICNEYNNCMTMPAKIRPTPTRLTQ